MTLKTTETTSAALKKTSHLTRSLGLGLTIVLVIAAIAGLVTLALNSVASAYNSIIRTIDDPPQRSVGDPDHLTIGDSPVFVLGR
ncbi:MAG TPA: hypothetical protein VGE97_07985 [Nitrososphaera sp.]|jgi:hypothetical protein